MYLLRRNLIYVYALKNIINLKFSATSEAKFNISWKKKVIMYIKSFEL